MDNPISEIINTPQGSPVDSGQTEQLRRQAPAFIYPLILQLRHPHPDLSQEQIAAIIQRIALSIPDPARLRILLDPEGTGEFDSFYAAARVEAPSTDDTIDTFLSTYGHTDPAEDELLNRLIFNPVPADYALSLDRTEQSEPRDEQDSLIDAFISAHPEEIPSEPAPEPAPTAAPATPQPLQQGDLLSQSLAKIFIKQGHYRQAYEIIHSLSLNYPEKSIYFADQLRFLRKLILIKDAADRNKKKK
ncbi:MAG: hypothetical protein K2I64_03690 [Muribaculaceae bacterium]|nr:hypothetical protein [Muribaculaceae bacterium]